MKDLSETSPGFARWALTAVTNVLIGDGRGKDRHAEERPRGDRAETGVMRTPAPGATRNGKRQKGPPEPAEPA